MRIYMKYLLPILIMSSILLSCSNNNDEDLKNRADQLAHKFIIVDTHIDVPYTLSKKWEDVANTTTSGNFDYIRARKGGLDSPFMSIYVSPKFQDDGGAVEEADKLIDLVESIVENNPDKFAIAATVDEVKKQFDKGLISFPMGMENGAPIENMELLQHFYERGIRYITLAHGKANHICDSSYDKEIKWNGLSPFGKELVAEMNKIGMMIDVSHLTDEAFYQVIELTKTPIIDSHSACRHFTPGFERNVSDEMIKAIAANGGVLQINFGSGFLTDESRIRDKKYWAAVTDFREKNNLEDNDPKIEEFKNKYKSENPYKYADVSNVADHIDHVVKLAGIDHVGLGSDFDGLGDSLPTGLKDVSMYPNLIYELLKRDYSEEDIEKICSGNILRVWKQNENYAAAN